MPPAVRLSDLALVPGDAHGCPGCAHVCIGPTISGSSNVDINSLSAIRVGDPGIHAACCGPNTYNTDAGSPNVYVNSIKLVRQNDATAHCGGRGSMIMGSPNVLCN